MDSYGWADIILNYGNPKHGEVKFLDSIDIPKFDLFVLTVKPLPLHFQQSGY